jgi:Icc-related predicted phosphoesterase
MEKDSKMNIYAVADIHGRQDRLDLIKNHVTLLKPDVLVIAGDITGHHGLFSLMGQLNDLPIPVLAVRGNMDSQEVEKLLEQYPNISSLHKKKVTIKGVSFVGLGGTIPVPFCSRICLREKRLIEETDYLIGRDSVLVSHPPPYGTLDEGFGNLHAGSRGLRRLILEKQPRMLICGHIHERPGVAFLAKTIVVNCSMGRSGAGAVIGMNNGHTPTVSMIG